MRLSCGEASAARACRAADEGGVLVGLLPDRMRHQARRLALAGNIVELRLIPIPPMADVPYSVRLAMAADAAGMRAMRRWCVVRLDPQTSPGPGVSAYRARVILRFELIREPRGLSASSTVPAEAVYDGSV